jgi:hypothetical protein
MGPGGGGLGRAGELDRGGRPVVTMTAPDPAAWAADRLDDACVKVRGCGPGERNATLRGQAWRVGKVLAWGLPRGEAEAALVEAGVAAGLPLTEARTTARGGLDSGAREPEPPPAGRAGRATSRSRRGTPPPAIPAPPPPNLSPPAAAWALLRELWSAVEADPLPPAALAWAEARGLCAEVMHDAGCRVPPPDLLRELWRAHGRDAFLSAGLLRTKDDADCPAWKAWPDEPAARLWMPLWHPARPAAPVSYRWRALESDAKAKALGAPVAGPDVAWRDWPLGVRWPASVWQGSRASTAAGAVRPGAGVVVLVEGEPDWLTVARVVEPGGVVLGMPGTRGLPPHWWCLLRAARRVVLAMHDDKAGRVSSAKARAMLATMGGAECPPVVQVSPPPGCDWNDAWRARGWSALAELVDVVMREG